MTEQDLATAADDLERRLEHAETGSRPSLHSEVMQLIARCKAQGLHVPRRVKNMDDMLTDEEIEARFDNMPV
ncbi:MAG: hypothetical protein AAFR45_05450 [Pseudomonadota bacterium]